MTVLPTVRRQLEEAAEQLARDRSSRRLSRSGAIIHQVGRVRAAGWVLAAASAAVVVVVVLAITRVHGQTSTPTPVTAGGGPGLVAPILGRGQAWSVVAIEQDTTPWQPPAASMNEFAPPPTELTSSSRAAVVIRAETFSWTLPSGDGRGRTRSLGKPRFIGSAQERGLWRANGSRSVVQLATGGFSTTSQTGFSVGDRNFSYRQLLHFPTDPVAVSRMFTGSVSNQVSAIAATFAQVPLPSSARVALFDALANLSGVQNLGSVRDPLGRLGIGLAAPAATPPRQPPAGPGSGPGTPLPTREQLIFDPRTQALLASETVLLTASAIPSIGTGYPISWTAYTGSKAVRAASVQGLKQAPPCAPGQVQISLGPSVSPQTGEHAYLFALIDRFNTPCSIDGYPSVRLSLNPPFERAVGVAGG